MSRVKEHAVVILQHLAEFIDDLIAFAAQVIKLLRARHNAELLRQRRHDGDKRVAGLSKDPLAKLHPRVDFVAGTGDLALEAAERIESFHVVNRFFFLPRRFLRLHIRQPHCRRVLRALNLNASHFNLE